MHVMIGLTSAEQQDVKCRAMLPLDDSFQQAASDCTQNQESLQGERCVLLVIIVLGGHFDIVCHQIHGVETNTKLANQIDISTLLHLFQESCIHADMAIIIMLITMNANHDQNDCSLPSKSKTLFLRVVVTSAMTIALAQHVLDIDQVAQRR